MKTVDQRVAVLDSIGSKENREGSRLLDNAFRDRSPNVRIKAIETIAEQGMRDALPLVETLLSDRNEKVRYIAAECIGRLMVSVRPTPVD